jgi:hypothetical protein
MTLLTGPTRGFHQEDRPPHQRVGGLKSCGGTLLMFHSLKKAYNAENTRLSKTGAGMTYEDLQRDPSKVNLISTFSIPHSSFIGSNT